MIRYLYLRFLDPVVMISVFTGLRRGELQDILAFISFRHALRLIDIFHLDL